MPKRKPSTDISNVKRKTKGKREYCIQLSYFLRTSSEKQVDTVKDELTNLVLNYLKDWTKRKDWTGASVSCTVTNLEE